jgi:hypothetical protein
MLGMYGASIIIGNLPVFTTEFDIPKLGVTSGTDIDRFSG